MNLQCVGRWREIGHLDPLGADLRGQPFDLLMRLFEEFVEQAEFMHQFERRRMHRIAAKVAQEVGMLFQHHDVDAGASQEKAEHHPGRSAADDAAFRRYQFVGHGDMLGKLCGKTLRRRPPGFNLSTVP